MQRLSNFYWGITVGVLITLTFLYSLILNLNKPLSLMHGDAFLVNFVLKHWMGVIFSGNWSEFSRVPMLYGFENSLFFTDHHFIQALIALPFYMVTRDIMITSNLLVIITILLSFLSMYLLVWHVTKSVLASLMGGIIFVFNPFVFARFPDQLILISLQWIPLIFLYFERSLEKPNNKNLFLFLCFLTCQLLSSLYYSVFLTVILPLYAATRIFQRHVGKDFLRRCANRGALAGLLLFLAAVGISGYYYYRVHSDYHIERSLEQEVPVYSARPSDYLFTAPQNFLYGGLKEKAANAWPEVIRLGIYSEHNLFWGIVPFLLFVSSFFVVKKSPYKALWRVCLVLLVLSFLLSLGPIIAITDSLRLPGLYGFFYKLNPLFPFLRTAARFGVFVFFFLAFIVALTWVEIEKRLDKKTSFLLGVFLIGVVLLEYWNKPLEFYHIGASTKEFYRTVNKQGDMKVILDYPIGNRIPYPYAQARIEDFDAHYLLYAVIVHNKKLFNGYTGFLPEEYYKRANFLSINFPTNNKLEILKMWGVDGIILHKDEFNVPSEYGRLRSELLAKGVPEIVSTDVLALFDLTKWREVP